MAERARLAREPRRVAVLADGGDRVHADALDRERARAHLVAGSALDRARLAGQDRLVDAQRVGVLERPVGDDLVARLEPHEVAGDELVDMHPPRVAVANDRRVRRDERREPVERALRADLLHRADPGVRDEDAEEERVLPLAERERHGAGDGEDQVEDREDVGADDARVRAARPCSAAPGRAWRGGASPPPRRGHARRAGSTMLRDVHLNVEASPLGAGRPLTLLSRPSRRRTSGSPRSGLRRAGPGRRCSRGTGRSPRA